MKRAIVFVANGSEEVEAVTPIDYLRRAGIEVTVAGIGERDIQGARGIRMTADLAVYDIEGAFDCVIVPGGGEGSKAIAQDADACELIRSHFAAGKLTAAICAAPVVVLGKACGILAGRNFTCYPGLEKDDCGGKFRSDRVVTDGNLITARAAGCAGEFSYAIIAALMGRGTADKVAGAVLL
jgi:protein deglycase